LQPFAYGLRDHQVFDAPIKIDRDKTVKLPVPTAWAHEIPGVSVAVLPLVDGQNLGHSPGWCSYVYRHEESPELEVLCGGINEKIAKAAGLWRQGNLLHFGFEQSPAEMNETGCALLVNSIAYIARFTEDRPITDVTSPFVGPAPQDRGAVLRALMRGENQGLPYLEYILAETLYKTLAAQNNEERLAWYRENEGYLHGDEDGKLVIDEAAKVFGVPPNIERFFDKAIAALDVSERTADAARQLLDRYAPDGPSEGGAAAWQSWWKANRAYSFFSDSGGYRWYLDPLAKQRSIPTSQLRGPARADLRHAPDKRGSKP
jgi:hypothetical protein